MHIRPRFSLWLIPLLGALLGYAYAFVFIHGLVVPWQFVGKPSDNISKIIGFVGYRNLFVETESGDFYSIEFHKDEGGYDFPIVWKKEENRNIEPDTIRKPILIFYSLPVPFKVKQLYEMEFPIMEGEEFVKYALSEDGNLWMWSYGQSGLATLSYIAYPIVGFFYGSILALLIKIGTLFWRKYGSKPI